MTQRFEGSDSYVATDDLKLAVNAAITIGRPIANTTLHILDAERAVVPLGVVGELWICAIGARGGASSYFFGSSATTAMAALTVTTATTATRTSSSAGPSSVQCS